MSGMVILQQLSGYCQQRAEIAITAHQDVTHVIDIM
jgi:hypothetical protein